MSAQVNSNKHRYTFEEYVQLEQQTGIRYEYYQGEVFPLLDDAPNIAETLVAMASGTKSHNYIAYNINSLLNQNFKTKGCRAFQENVKLQLDGGRQYIYPDIIFSCDAEDVEVGFSVKNPVLLVEVISPSSEIDDRVRKWKLYRRIPSLRYYLLVSQQQPYVEMYSRKHATALFQFQDYDKIDDIIQFPDLDFSMSLQAIYDGIQFAPSLEDITPPVL